MKVLHSPKQVAQLDLAAGCVLTIGIFDGVHRGHQAILAHAVRRAKQMGVPCVVLTFDPHPRLVHDPDTHLHLITSLADRFEALGQQGVDATLVVNYTLEFAAQSAEDFVRTWLVDLLKARLVVVGSDVRFGAGNAGDRHTLEQLGQKLGFEVEIVDNVCAHGGKRWSSTWVRQALEKGDVAEAARVLGRPHRLRGTVVHGLQRGRQLGFPTANLDAETAGVVPPDGVYAGWLWACDGASGLRKMPAAISIGTNPTFKDVPKRTVEAHVLGRADLNLYGQEVAVDLVSYLRPMISFAGLDELLKQMHKDIADSAAVLNVPVPEPIDPAQVTAC